MKIAELPNKPPTKYPTFFDFVDALRTGTVFKTAGDPHTRWMRLNTESFVRLNDGAVMSIKDGWSGCTMTDKNHLVEVRDAIMFDEDPRSK